MENGFHFCTPWMMLLADLVCGILLAVLNAFRGISSNLFPSVSWNG